MGLKYSTSKCTSRTIDYIRNRDADKLTLQLNRRQTSFRNKRKLKDREQTNIQLLKLEIDNDDQQRSAIHIAAIEGNATIIVALYEYMHTVDVTDTLGRTALHYAAIVGNEETLTTLLLCNPDIHRISKDGTTPLHEAIIHNHPRILSLLVQYNADVNILFQDYLPSLILAVYLQHRSIVEILIHLGIDPNVVDAHMNRSALHYAAYFHDNTTIFHLLLSSTVHLMVNINARDNDGFSVLDYARANIHGCTAIADLLLQLNVFDPDRGEISIEHIQIERPNIKIFQSSNELSSFKEKENENNRSKKTKNKKIFQIRTKSK